MKRVVIVGLSLAAALATALGIFGSRDVFASNMVNACEDALKERLKAPSTYQRIKVTETQQNITFDQYFAANNESPAVQQFLRAMAKQPPVQLIAFIEYDAANAFGTPLRSISKCTYNTLDPTRSTDSKHLVKIDGKSNTQWLVDRVVGNAKQPR